MMEVIAEHNVIIEALEHKDEAKIVNAMKAHLEKSMTAFKVK
ncbi:hypothetical protein [Staphylococcus arlettae]|nr:hypothetical protein [Staphylococcus arlettae]